MRLGIVMLQTHVTRQQTTMFSLNCWLKLILKHITLHFTVNCLSLLQEMFKNNSFMIPEKSNTFRVAAHEQTCLG